jgi:hypothetical protein
VYGYAKETDAMIVISMCSFGENLPGLRVNDCPNTVNRRVGRTRSSSLPHGSGM